MGRPLLRTIQLGVTVASFALLWHLADGEAALRRLAGANPSWIGAALVMLTLQTVLSALRWRLTAAQLGIVLSPGTAIREYYLAQIVNQILPGGVLGDAGRAIRARRDAGLLASGQAVLFERLAGQLALFAVFAAGVASTRLVPGSVDTPNWLLPATLMLAVSVAIVFWSGRARHNVPVDSCAKVVDSPAGRLLRSVYRFRAAFWHAVAAPEVRTRQLAMSLGTALCNIAAFACCAAAANVLLSAPNAMVLIPLILFSMLIPLTVSGWGLREGAAATLLPLAGGSSAGGLAASVAFGLTLLLAALPGFFALASAVKPVSRSVRVRS